MAVVIYQLIQKAQQIAERYDNNVRKLECEKHLFSSSGDGVIVVSLAEGMAAKQSLKSKKTAL
jgi:hypothetical protein